MPIERPWSPRIARLAGIWIVVAAAEYVAWRHFLQNAFYRDFFMPIALFIAILGVAASWRAMGRRVPDRRDGDRREEERRGE